MFKRSLLCVLGLITLAAENDGARILSYYSMPFFSHQVVFRPLTLELLKRGHELVVVTTHPMFPNGDGPANLTEIDIGNCSFSIVDQARAKHGNTWDRYNMEILWRMELTLVEAQMQTTQMKNLLSDKSQKFDLIIAEELLKMVLGLSYHFKTPIILASTLGGIMATFLHFGVPTHLLIYPPPTNFRIYNLTLSEKFEEVYFGFKMYTIVRDNMILFDQGLKRIFGPDVPPLEKLTTNVDLLFLNIHPLWDFNRPVPPNVIYLGNLQKAKQKDLPLDVKEYLDSSKNGVIFVSFGTTVDSKKLSNDFVRTLVNVFSKLPYDVLWKWDGDELPGRSANIRISKWLPQPDLLRHPKIKLFVTQGGMQSTHESMAAGVPMIGIPIFGDQFFNVEQYLYYKIGEKIDAKTITEEKLNNSIYSIIGDDSYRKNIIKLNLVMNDQPLSPIDTAIWWVEYVLRYGGAKHLRSQGADVTWEEYLMLDVIKYLLFGIFLALIVFTYLAYFLYSTIFGKSEKVKKN